MVRNLNTPQHPKETRFTDFNVLHPMNPGVTVENHTFCHEIPANINEFNQLYPINNEENQKLYEVEKQKFLAKYPNARFVGRLATYKYLDMDKVIEQVYQDFCEI